MSWRDGFDAIGSFRGVPFLTNSASGEFGRRIELHEFPGRDEPYPEDLGRATRKFTVEALVIEPGYMAKRDQLIAAAEASGPGTLVHPYYGTRRVICQNLRVSESTREGGIAKVNLEFIDADAAELQGFPTSAPHTPDQVTAAADAVTTEAASQFTDTITALQAVADQADNIEAALDEALTAARGVATGLSQPVTELIATPANLAGAIVDTIGQIKTAIETPLKALAIYERLFAPSMPTVGSSAKAQAAASSTNATEQLIGQVALADLATLMANATPATRTEADTWLANFFTASDTVGDAEHPVTGEPISDSVYSAIVALRAAVSADLRTRGVTLPEVVSHTPGATLPALVIAQQLYGDASRADEIVSLNNISHPGFVPGGEALEVLRD